MSVWQTDELKKVLPEYECVSEAPTMAEMERRGISPQIEADKLYKALKCEESGGRRVYLVQNPALMSFQASNRASVIRRKPPQDLGKLGDQPETKPEAAPRKKQELLQYNGSPF